MTHFWPIWTQIFVFCCCVKYLICYESLDIEINLGASEGLTRNSTVSQNTLKNVLEGVEKGEKNSLYFYGLLKLYGLSVSKNPDIAMKHFKIASEKGHTQAITACGVMYLTGTSSEGVDHPRAIQYFRQGVTAGDMDAHWLLGKMLMEGKGVPAPSYIEAASLLTKASDANLPQAEFHLALMYEYGLGVQQDFKNAMKYYRRATEKNHVESMYHLALMYAFGRGADQDFHRARPLLEAAASSEHAPSIYYIGVFKTYGYGCPINYQQAVHWFDRAASLDDKRVSDKAAKASQELQGLVDLAEKDKDQLFDQLHSRMEVR